MKKILLFIILNILLFNFSYADDADSKQKELETKIKLLEKELEIEKLKKELEEQKKANEKTKNKDKSTDVNQGELNKNNQENKETIKINDEIDLNKEILKEIKSLGKFQEPKRYPEEFKIQFLNKGCITWSCVSKKTAREMSKIFSKKEKFNQMYPGNQIRGMALFEIFYLNTLKKYEKNITRYLEGSKKKKDAKMVSKLISLNKSRENMRKALGMDLSVSIEDTLEVYYLMAQFLDLGKIKEQKIPEDIKKRKKFLSQYKKSFSDLNMIFKKNKDKPLYDAIKTKNK